MTYGLINARKFIVAVRAKEVSTQDFNNSEFVLPLVMRQWSFGVLDVPVDFAAGQIYEAVWEQTTRNLGEKARKMSTRQSDYREWARTEYRKENCDNLGK